MLLGPDSQPDIVHHGRRTRRLDQARAHIRLLTRLIREELARAPQFQIERPAPTADRRRAWVLEAQARRRDWFVCLKQEQAILESRVQALRCLTSPSGCAKQGAVS